MNPLLSLLLRAALAGAGLAATLLPRSLELRLGPPLGRLALALDPRRRRIARDNIRRCLPQLGEEGAERLLRENYEHYGTLGLELLHLFSPVPGHYRAYAGRIAVLEHYDRWKAAHDKGRGVLFVSAHLANWEMMAAIGAMGGIPISIVTRQLKPAWLHRKVAASRLAAGCVSLAGSHSLAQVLRALRRGESVGFVMDQYAHPPAGMPARFFGATVNTLAAVGSIAARTGAAIVPVRQVRDRRGVLRVVIEPELDLGPALKDPAMTTQALTGLVEAWIRETPSQWLWAHRRFKNAEWPAEAAARGGGAS